MRPYPINSGCPLFTLREITSDFLLNSIPLAQINKNTKQHKPFGISGDPARPCKALPSPCPSKMARQVTDGEIPRVYTNKNTKQHKLFGISGDPSGNRTPDTVIKSHVLYRLS